MEREGGQTTLLIYHTASAYGARHGRITIARRPQGAADLYARAGITTYSPLAHFGAKAMGAACTTGVIGFGGLGHMAVKLAKAMVEHPPHSTRTSLARAH